MDPRDYILEIEGLTPANTGGTPGVSPENISKETHESPEATPGGGKPWIAIHFKCCHTYARLYRNPAGSAYQGACPKCGKTTRAAIGEGGTNARFFTAE